MIDGRKYEIFLEITLYVKQIALVTKMKTSHRDYLSA